MSVLTRGLGMDLNSKEFGSEGSCAEYRLKWGWESVFHHIHLSLKHLNYFGGKDEFSISTANLLLFFLITVSKQHYMTNPTVHRVGYTAELSLGKCSTSVLTGTYP